MRSARRRSVAAVVVLAGVALGAPATGALAAVPVNIVQLGDSYSAGNGAGNYYGPKGCYRSTTSWARQWVGAISTKQPVIFQNRACSGGVLDNLEKERYMGKRSLVVFTPDTVEKDDPAAESTAIATGACTSKYPEDERYSVEVTSAEPGMGGGTVIGYDCKRYMLPQWDVVDETTDIVILTIGGNDLKFKEIIESCFLVGKRSPQECKERIDNATRGLAALSADTEAFLNRLRSRMRKNARIVLLSYPYLEKNEDLTLGERAFGIGTKYALGAEIRKLGRAGDAAQRKAVEAVTENDRDGDGPAVTYVDRLKRLFAGHEPDGRVTRRNPDRWLYELFERVTPTAWYHYNPLGHANIAKLMLGYGAFGYPITTTGSRKPGDEKPFAWIASPYVGTIGSTFLIDGSGSYSPNGSLKSYEWDFDGDGVYDQVTSEPRVEHTYAVATDTLMKLRVTDDDGRTATATTPVDVSDDGDEVARDLDNCPDVGNPGQEDEDTDGIGDECDPTPGFPTEDREGVYETGGSGSTGDSNGTDGGGDGAAGGDNGGGGAGGSGSGSGNSAGPGETPAPAAPAPAAAAPTATLLLDTVRTQGAGRRVAVAVFCDAASSGTCEGTLTVRLRGRDVSTPYRIEAPQRATVTVRLTRAQRRALRRHAQRVTVRLADTTGSALTQQVRLPRVR